MDWFYLALLAPLIYAVVNLIDDNLMRHIFRSPHSGAIISGVFAGLPLLSLFFYDYTSIPLRYALLASLAGFLLVAFYYCYFLALDRESPSVVVALTNTSPIIIGVFAFLFLGERFSGMDIIGLSLLLLGSLALSLKREQKRVHLSRSIIPIFCGGILISVHALLIKQAFDNASFYPVYMWMSAGMLAGGMYLLFVLYHSDQRAVIRDVRRIVRKYFWLFLLIEGLALIAEFVLNLSISKGPVTAVKTIEAIQPAVVLLIAMLFYPLSPTLFREAKEGGVTKKIISMILIIAGLYLLYHGFSADLGS